MKAAQVGHLFFVTAAGLATPSIDALLAPRLGCGLRFAGGRSSAWAAIRATHAVDAVGAALFGDGAAAVLLGGDDRAGRYLEAALAERALLHCPGSLR